MLRTDDIAHTSLPSPHLLVADASIWATSLLVVMVRQVFCLCVCVFPSLFCCPLSFWNSPQTCMWEGFLLCEDFSPITTPSPGWVSFPKSFVSVFVFYILSYLLLNVSVFVFYILSYLLLKRLGCLSRSLVSSASIQLFCGSCSAFTWSFDEFVGGESDLPILFLCHFGTVSKYSWLKVLPFYHLSILCHTLLTCRVSAEKSALWEFLFILFVVFPSLLLISFFVFNICQFDYSVFWCVPRWGYPARDSALPQLGWLFAFPS